MAVMNYLEAIKTALHEEMARDENVFVIGEDVGVRGGVFRATEGLYETYGEERVIDSPLAESAIAGVGVGAAMYGMRPVCEMQFADFILPAVNQIVSEAAKIRYRSNNDWTCPVTIRAPFGGGVKGALYHSQSLEALFAGTPGLRIVIPSSPRDARALLKASIRSNDPVLFFEHKRAYRLLKEDVPEEEEVMDITKAAVKREGDDLTVITYGLCVHYALEAAKRLEEDGISVHVLDLRSVYPMDREAIVEAVNKTGKALLVTEDNYESSVLGEVAAIIGEECLFQLDAPLQRVCGPDSPAMPFAPSLEKHFLVSPEKIEKAMRQLAAF
ncbi:alpha-ketoacid dehydrogenase subunit beta [Bacillaceae bacterium SIJ1]|uniref:alpha-ketoacid dehydrogenase subunit beta n=1 Tax=Litoribacterium kuwaitense TaxID=1398745 RepID=UPI0013ECD52C|nr:alpha-ketoacid dehydrogenase subunit beta [Litoribacterium kuwaitense]NGP43624.1 alpha-ketoacid dehydrogenase subunit beta [Litoribacterium kuwaitense]